MGAGCDGGDVIDVLRYMTKYGLPDESCMPYGATDHTKYGKHATKCPAEGYCVNCMPIDDVDTCWPVAIASHVSPLMTWYGFLQRGLGVAVGLSVSVAERIAYGGGEVKA